MPKTSLWWGLAFVALSVAPSPAASASAGDSETELWRDKNFVKAAEAIRKGNWEKTSTRAVAIIGLYEMGRALDRTERRLQAQADRFYGFVYWGSWVAGIYLILQLILSLAMIIRLRQRPAQRAARGSEQSEEEFRP
jgi:hypothetical protein